VQVGGGWWRRGRMVGGAPLLSADCCNRRFVATLGMRRGKNKTPHYRNVCLSMCVLLKINRFAVFFFAAPFLFFFGGGIAQHNIHTLMYVRRTTPQNTHAFGQQQLGDDDNNNCIGGNNSSESQRLRKHHLSRFNIYHLIHIYCTPSATRLAQTDRQQCYR